MAITVTGLQIADKVVRNGGFGLYLPNAEITSIAAGSVTSLLHFRNGQHSTNHWRNMNAGIWRPLNATGVADYWRTAADLAASTGVLSVDTDWADTTLTSEDFILLKYGITPIDFVDAMNRALRKNYFTNEEPLSTKPIDTTVADAGFQSTATTSYTVDATGTFSKVSTANEENVFPGMIASGHFVADNPADYIRQRYAVTEGEQVHAFTLTRLDSGTNVQTILYDVSNSAAVGTTVKHAQEQWQWAYRQETVPEDCKLMDLRIAAEGGSDNFFANASIFYRTRNLRVILDTKWETEFMAPQLAYVDIYNGMSVGDSLYEGFSAPVLPIPKGDYQFVSERAGANPFAIQFNTDHWFRYPIYIQGRRAHADVDGPFTLALGEATSADLDLMAWVTLQELFENPSILRKVPDAAVVLAKANAEVNKVKGQYKWAPSTKEKKVISVRGLGN